MAFAIQISLSSHTLTLLENGKVKKIYPVGVGKNNTPTPPGSYTIVNKRPNPGGPFGAMWLGLSVPHYGIHGTNNPASIGGHVSHGCVRMFNKDVLEVAAQVPLGTPVYVSK